jgi:integrase/recombinase XerC
MLNTHLTLFFEFLKHEKKLSAHTLLAYQSDLEQFFKFVDIEAENFSVTEINYQHIRGWISFLLNAKLTPQSVNRKLSSLKTFFKFLMVQKVISFNPMS